MVIILRCLVPVLLMFLENLKSKFSVLGSIFCHIEISSDMLS